MVEDAEKSGRIKSKRVLLSSPHQETQVAMALTAAVKGYRCIITMPEKMSKENR